MIQESKAKGKEDGSWKTLKDSVSWIPLTAIVSHLCFLNCISLCVFHYRQIFNKSLSISAHKVLGTHDFGWVLGHFIRIIILLEWGIRIAIADSWPVANCKIEPTKKRMGEGVIGRGSLLTKGIPGPYDHLCRTSTRRWAPFKWWCHSVNAALIARSFLSQI